MRNATLILVLTLGILFLSACGGGDGGSGGSSKWDQMIWDQDNWA